MVTSPAWDQSRKRVADVAVRSWPVGPGGGWRRGNRCGVIGRKTRVVPVPLAKAIKRRDRCCRFPGCNVSDRFTEIHHRVHWAKGGPTSRENCFLLCYKHHRMMHDKTGWTCQGDANDALTFTAPTVTTTPPHHPAPTRTASEFSYSYI